MTRDWQAWHRSYDDPSSALSHRLAAVVDALRTAVDTAPPGPIRLVSLCSGDARDIAIALTGHPRSSEISGCLVELDPVLASAASVNLDDLGSRLEVRCGDASDPAMFTDMAPADVLLLVGIFGNVSDDDVRRLITAVPAVCRPGASIIWSRHRRRPDLTPAIARWFLEVGCATASFASPGPGGYAVGHERWSGRTTANRLPRRLFTFSDDGPGNTDVSIGGEPG